MSIQHVLDQFVKDNKGIGYRKFDFFLEAMSEASDKDLHEFGDLMTKAIEEQNVPNFNELMLQVAHATKRMCEVYAVQCYPEEYMEGEQQEEGEGNPRQEAHDDFERLRGEDFKDCMEKFNALSIRS